MGVRRMPNMGSRDEAGDGTGDGLGIRVVIDMGIGIGLSMGRIKHHYQQRIMEPDGCVI